MRNEKGQFVKGASGNPAGRPKRADEQFLVDIWNEDGQRQFSNAVKRGEQWAVSKLVDKLFASPKMAEIDLKADMPQIVFDPTFLEADEARQKEIN